MENEGSAPRIDANIGSEKVFVIDRIDKTDVAAANGMPIQTAELSKVS